eukprot:COSAG06_NODE_274_length_18646_cov_21.468539_9_plen_74_part_00
MFIGIDPRVTYPGHVTRGGRLASPRWLRRAPPPGAASSVRQRPGLRRATPSHRRREESLVAQVKATNYRATLR